MLRRQWEALRVDGEIHSVWYFCLLLKFVIATYFIKAKCINTGWRMVIDPHSVQLDLNEKHPWLETIMVKRQDQAVNDAPSSNYQF